MTFRVFWTPFAEGRFDEILAIANDRAVLAEAAREIDRRFIVAPKKVGESRDGDMRVGFVDPLGVQFEVMQDVKTVIVHDVWRTDRK